MLGRHAELASEGDDIVLRDLGSTNGSRVGSERVLEERVPLGGRFSLGNVTFTLVDRQASPIPLAGPNEPLSGLADSTGPTGATAERADEARLARARRGSRGVSAGAGQIRRNASSSCFAKPSVDRLRRL